MTAYEYMERVEGGVKVVYSRALCPCGWTSKWYPALDNGARHAGLEHGSEEHHRASAQPATGLLDHLRGPQVGQWVCCSTVDDNGNPAPHGEDWREYPYFDSADEAHAYAVPRRLWVAQAITLVHPTVCGWTTSTWEARW